MLHRMYSTLYSRFSYDLMSKINFTTFHPGSTCGLCRNRAEFDFVKSKIRNVHFSVSHKAKFKKNQGASIRDIEPNNPSSDVKETSREATRLKSSVSEKFTPFQDESLIIRDIDEETWASDGVSAETSIHENKKQNVPRNTHNGKFGVFDIEELVCLLEEENALDLCVISVPKELDYSDYIIIASTRNRRQMVSLAYFVRQTFKRKELMHGEKLPVIEGTETSDWLALDLGNIILHVMLDECRTKMDLETLWSVGSQYDDLFNSEDPEIVKLLSSFQSHPSGTVSRV